MAKVQFNHWARMMAFCAGLLLMDTGIIAYFYPEDNPLIAAQYVCYYSLAVGLLLVATMWPIWILGRCLYIFQIFWLSFFIMLGFSVLTFFTTPTTIGGITLVMAALLYLIAAIRREPNCPPDVLQTAKKRIHEKL